MSSARQFAIIQLNFLLGIVIADVWIVPVLLSIVGASLTVALLIFLPRRHRLVVGLVPLAIVFGMLRIQNAHTEQRHDPLFLRAGKTVVLNGVVKQEVDRRLDGQKLTLRVSAVVENNIPTPVSAKTLVSENLYPERHYGERLTVRCLLSQPGVIDGFRYDEYLALSKIYSVCRNPAILNVTPAHSLDPLGMVLRGKQWMLNRFAGLLPEPHSSLIAAMLVGARRGLPDDLLLAFQRAGITHIIALSGFNITILASAVFSFTLAIGLRRKTAFWIVLAVLALFVIGTGAPSSVVRASIMGFLVLLARRLGRSSNIVYALLFAGTTMAAVSPRVVLHDVGFQLSFLATLGLVLFSGTIEDRLPFVPDALGIRQILAATFAATAGTLPVMLVAFGRLSLISPLVNILILPLVPLIMLLGFLAAALPFVGILFASAAWILLTWMMAVATTLGSLHFASVPFSAAIVPALLGTLLMLTMVAGLRYIVRQFQILAQQCE